MDIIAEMRVRMMAHHAHARVAIRVILAARVEDVPAYAPEVVQMDVKGHVCTNVMGVLENAQIRVVAVRVDVRGAVKGAMDVKGHVRVHALDHVPEPVSLIVFHRAVEHVQIHVPDAVEHARIRVQVAVEHVKMNVKDVQEHVQIHVPDAVEHARIRVPDAVEHVKMNVKDVREHVPGHA